MPSVTDLVDPWVEAGVLARLANMKVCLTGTMSVKRSVLVELLAAQGAEVVNRVPQADLLVDANPDNGKTVKQAEAARYGVPVIDEEVLVELMLGDLELNDIRKAHGLPPAHNPF